MLVQMKRKQLFIIPFIFLLTLCSHSLLVFSSFGGKKLPEHQVLLPCSCLLHCIHTNSVQCSPIQVEKVTEKLYGRAKSPQFGRCSNQPNGFPVICSCCEKAEQFGCFVLLCMVLHHFTGSPELDVGFVVLSPHATLISQKHNMCVL